MNNTYRLKGWYLLLNSIVALVTLSSLAGIAAVIVIMVFFIVLTLRSSSPQQVLPLMLFEGVFILFGGLLTLLGIIFPLGNALFSSLRVGPAGLELRIWPFYRLHYGWEQVIGLEQVKTLGGRLCFPMLRIKPSVNETQRQISRPDRMLDAGHGSASDDISVLPLLLVAFLIWSVKLNNLIPLQIFKGWPNGQLQRDLESRLGRMRPAKVG